MRPDWLFLGEFFQLGPFSPPFFALEACQVQAFAPSAFSYLLPMFLFFSFFKLRDVRLSWSPFPFSQDSSLLQPNRVLSHSDILGGVSAPLYLVIVPSFLDSS